MTKLEKVLKLVEHNAHHIGIMNSEMGELRDNQKEANTRLAKIETNITWLKDNYKWIMGLLGAIILVVVGVFFK